MTDLTWPKQRKLLMAPEIGFNAEVYRHFKDVDDFPSRAVARNACLIEAKDSRSTLTGRQNSLKSLFGKECSDLW